MVNRFEEGKMYRFTGSEAHDSWNEKMAVVLDGKPRKCIVQGRTTDFLYTGPGDAHFEGMAKSFTGTWGWSGNMKDWVEVDADGNDVFVEADEDNSKMASLADFLQMLSDGEDKPEEKEEESELEGFLGFLQMLAGLSDEEKPEEKEEPKEDTSTEDFMEFLKMLSGVSSDRKYQDCPEDDTTDLRFEVGKTYRYIGKKPHRRWNDRGMMDVVTDGKPRKCVVVMDDPLCNTGSTRANFEGVPENPRGFLVEGSDLSVWAWAGSMSLWEEVV
ncbi:MAG TPA: hypothetical protein VJ869_16125 [Sphaerochaeta sp.]|nr:hypothetical protein [Sphaerochaeta sp.]